MRTKHFIDRSVALLALLVLGPLLILIAIAVRRSGPVIFRHRRLGQHGREFDVYKFRTMINGQPTQFGQRLRNSSLDELPNLVNVLRGDMSLVGPRPMPQAEFDLGERHSVRPGLTGYAQVHGYRGKTSCLETRLAYDLHYVEHRSLLLDLKILFKTIPAVIRYSEG